MLKGRGQRFWILSSVIVLVVVNGACATRTEKPVKDIVAEFTGPGVLEIRYAAHIQSVQVYDTLKQQPDMPIE